MSIHRDLLPIIFAYTELSRRRRLSYISRQSRQICQSYHYIISVEGYNINCFIDELLFLGVYHNDSRIVSILLKQGRVDPSESTNYAINMASNFGHIEVAKLLFNDQRVFNSLTYVEKLGYSNMVNEINKK